MTHQVNIFLIDKNRMHSLRRKSISLDTNTEIRTLQTFLDSDTANANDSFEKTLWILKMTARNTENLKIAEPHLDNIKKEDLSYALLTIQKDAVHNVVKEKAKSCYF